MLILPEKAEHKIFRRLSGRRKSRRRREIRQELHRRRQRPPNFHSTTTAEGEGPPAARKTKKTLQTLNLAAGLRRPEHPRRGRRPPQTRPPDLKPNSPGQRRRKQAQKGKPQQDAPENPLSVVGRATSADSQRPKDQQPSGCPPMVETLVHTSRKPGQPLARTHYLSLSLRGTDLLCF